MREQHIYVLRPLRAARAQRAAPHAQRVRALRTAVRSAHNHIYVVGVVRVPFLMMMLLHDGVLSQMPILG